jgi:transcriptional repressor NrdR
MKCHHCGSCDNKVIESRDVADGEAIRRRRECLSCGHRFTTYERIEKLLAGLQHACEKTPVTNLQLESFVAQIERSLYDRGEPEVSSTDIGEMIMEGLPKLSEVAYVRFASVYRNFKDITGFEKELSKIRENRAETKQSSKKQTGKQKIK